ncbi:hypothetical protein O181_014775 [Austropuccinia psidii MF-1]|uniref:Endonuclease/exonuclease/phosphatase domain-containing protein n=1 Tax=Austropuccinia psidii MF-1 TaxID=1389203 RepID=A0A9Q3GQ94_9BASI|nr:hypothetical protein [Austropuccinia psidii MF-1]
MEALGAEMRIDLLWANTQASRIIQECKIQRENHSSDHQPMVTKFNLEGDTLNITEEQVSMRPNMLNKRIYIEKVSHRIQHEITGSTTPSRATVDSNAEKV